MFAPRFEYKFRVDEDTAAAVRDYIGAYLEPDSHVIDRRLNCYPVNNLYLDSDDLLTYWHGIQNAQKRYKLRVRSYTENPDAPVYLEIKRQIGDECLKSRAAIKRTSMDALLEGDLPTPEDIHGGSEQDLRSAIEFVELVRAIDARPRAHVRYLREAWVSHNSDDIRLTMDRDVLVAPKGNTDFLTARMTAPTRPFGSAVVLEIKITGNAPFWFVDLEQTAGLRRGAAAKYCDGVLARGEREFSPTFDVPADVESVTAWEMRRQKLATPPTTLPSRDALFRLNQKIA